MLAVELIDLALWVVVGAPTMLVVTIIAGRLLGARRGWVELLASGVVGWTAAVLVAGDLTEWAWDSVEMALIALGFGIVLTMLCALGLDLLAPMGSLARGERAGLVEVTNPLAGFRSQTARARRYREVLRRARANGVVSRGIDLDGLPMGVRRTLEDAGGMFVKLGQVASTRADLLPAAWCEELARLRSQAEPAPPEIMRPHLEALLGRPTELAYAEFDWTPIASASIAQVYSARLHSGEQVVVKVQRPGLEQRVEIDAAAVMQLARLIERRTVLGLAMRPADLAQEFIDNVREELDFRIEAANGALLRAAFADRSGISVPAVYPDLSNAQVLTEERIDAVSIGDLDRLNAMGIDLEALADHLLGEFFHQIFHVGTFHSDPHPGNILVEPDGSIVLIDLGAVGRLSSGQRSAVVDLMVAAANGDAATLREALLEVTTVDPTASVRELDAALGDLMARHMRDGGGISTAAFQDLAVVVGRFGLRLPRWFGTLSRTMVTLEGTIHAIDPDFSLVEAARAHAGEAGGGGGGRLATARELFEKEAMGQLPRLRRIPQRLDELFGQAASGRLSVRLSPFADERTERIVTRLVDRFVLGLIASAIGIGSVLLLGVDKGPMLGGDIPLNEALGYTGLASATVLTLRILAGIIRDGTT